MTNPISFEDKVMCSVDEGVAVDVVYLDLSKAFNTVSHSILPEKLAAQGLGVCMLHWVKYWPCGYDQSVVVHGAKSSWGPATSGAPRAQY